MYEKNEIAELKNEITELKDEISEIKNNITFLQSRLVDVCGLMGLISETGWNQIKFLRTLAEK